MNAEEARRLSFIHSKRMQCIYSKIENYAKKGYNEVHLCTNEASKEEMQVLRDNGYSAEYKNAEIDGGQYIVISW